MPCWTGWKKSGRNPGQNNKKASDANSSDAFVYADTANVSRDFPL